MARFALTLVSFAMALGMLLFPAPSDAQQGFQHRQYYGNWHAHRAGYAYRPYYFKPHAQFHGYKHHYVIHHPKHPQHLYFYNPYKKQFWGRCPVATNGKAQYSLLAEKDRSGDLEKIPEAAFPEPGPLPTVPEATDDLKLDLPPDDLPDVSALPGGDAKAP
jgi:hypothetical protein